MSVSSNLELLVLSETMSQKATGVNLGLQGLEQALSEQYSLDTSAATTPGDDVTIPFDDTNDLSDRTALRCIYLVLSAGATAAFNVIHPDNKHLFIVKNETSQTATVKTAAGTGIDVATTETRLLYCDGTNVVEITLPGSGGGGGGTAPYDIDVSVYGRATNGQVIARFIVGREITFPADFAGSQGSVLVNPTATNTFDVDDDGSKIGEISVSTGGVVTFTTTLGAEQVVAAGSELVIHNQASADATLEGLTAVILGTVTLA
jgi:hypothetical protein